MVSSSGVCWTAYVNKQFVKKKQKKKPNNLWAVSAIIVHKLWSSVSTLGGSGPAVTHHSRLDDAFPEGATVHIYLKWAESSYIPGGWFWSSFWWSRWFPPLPMPTGCLWWVPSWKVDPMLPADGLSDSPCLLLMSQGEDFCASFGL